MGSGGSWGRLEAHSGLAGPNVLGIIWAKSKGEFRKYCPWGLAYSGRGTFMVLGSADGALRAEGLDGLGVAGA